MISARAKEVVAQSGDGRRIAMIVTVEAEAELRDLGSIPDFRERGAQMRAILARKKQPILAALRDYERGGLRIVDNSPGAPNLILSAPARLWRRVIREQPLIETGRGFRIDADSLDFAAAPKLLEA